MKLLFIDTETTGLDWNRHGIIQIAGIIDIDGEIREEFNFVCRPFAGQVTSPEALAINKTTAEEIAQFQHPSEAYRKLLAVLDKHVNRYSKSDKFYMVGQNTKFDYDFLKQWFKLNNDPYLHGYVAYHLLDLINMTALFKLAGRISVENMKLETVAKYFKVELDAHDAFNDIRATRQIFYKYLNMVKTLEPQPALL